MSIRLMTMVWDIQFPTQSQLLVALKLADFANDDGGSVFPSRNRLVENCQCSETTVKNTLRCFREIGLLIVVEEGGHGPRDTTRYAWNMKLVKALLNGDCAITGGAVELEIAWAEGVDNKGSILDPLDEPRGQPDELRGQPIAAKGSTHCPQPFTNHQIESPSRERAGAIGRAPASARPSITITAGDVSWEAWLDAITTGAGEAGRMAAERAGRLTVDARWPREGVPLPKIALPKAEALTETSRRMSGEAT